MLQNGLEGATWLVTQTTQIVAVEERLHPVPLLQVAPDQPPGRLGGDPGHQNHRRDPQPLQQLHHLGRREGAGIQLGQQGLVMGEMAEAFDACLGKVELAGHLGGLGQREEESL